MKTDAPWAATQSVREARDAYLAENGFTVEAYEDPWTEASFFGVRFRVPNTPKHRWAIKLHDLHHVATGYGTDLIGEAEISAWELRRGLRGVGVYVSAIVVAGAAAGLVLAPRRLLVAWRTSRSRGSLFQTHHSYDVLLQMSVAELRHELGAPTNGTASGPRRLHAYAPPSVGEALQPSSTEITRSIVGAGATSAAVSAL